MHIAIAAHDFYPDPGSGGTGRYVYETARRFVERGHRVSVVTRRRGDVPRREPVDGIAVYRYDISIADRSVFEVLPQLPGAVRTVSRHLDDLASGGRPDVMSLQGPVTSLLLDRAADPDIPRICTFHSPWPVEYAIKTRHGSALSEPRRRLNIRARRVLEGRLLSRTDGMITLSEFMCGELRRVYGPAADTAVIPGGVDTDRFAPDAGPSEHIDSDHPSFLTVRRLTPRMGHDLLLDAFASVLTEHPEARLYIAGDGPLREDLERKAAALGIGDRTAFLGYVPDADLPGVYADADLFVLPTVELEGFGLATLEALASATPVIATPVGGTVEVLDGLADDPDVPEGVLAAAADADALARRMLAWADLSADTRQAAGRACRRHARGYMWEQTTAALESYYAERR